MNNGFFLVFRKDLAEAVRLVTSIRVEESRCHPERLDACVDRYQESRAAHKEHTRATMRSTRVVLLALVERFDNWSGRGAEIGFASRG